MKASKYELTGVEIKAKGQAALVAEYLKEGPMLVSEIEKKLESDPRFQTRQTALRIASYYVCVFKKAGQVRPIEVEVANAEETSVEITGF